MTTPQPKLSLKVHMVQSVSSSVCCIASWDFSAVLDLNSQCEHFVLRTPALHVTPRNTAWHTSDFRLSQHLHKGFCSSKNTSLVMKKQTAYIPLLHYSQQGPLSASLYGFMLGCLGQKIAIWIAKLSSIKTQN